MSFLERLRIGTSTKKNNRFDHILEAAKERTRDKLTTDLALFKEEQEQEGQDLSAEELRKKFKINCIGKDVTDPILSFGDLPLPKWLERNLEAANFADPTPVQMQTIPCILDGRDMLGCSQTGSGKTLAYTLPLLVHLFRNDSRSQTVRSIILAPTQELARQVFSDVKLLARGSKYRILRLAKNNANKNTFATAVDILVATPMGLLKSVDEEFLDVGGVEMLVLDEMDSLLNPQFLPQLDKLMSYCTRNNTTRVQKVMFSASLMHNIESLAATVLNNHIKVFINHRNSIPETVEQRVLFAGDEASKYVTMHQAIREGVLFPLLVFVQTKDRADKLYKEMRLDYHQIDVIHADRSSAARSRALENLRSGKVNVLIATNLLGRGVDVPFIGTVINFDLPNSAVDYIHRIGRTGRLGNQGLAITLFTRSDIEIMGPIINIMHQSKADIPEYLLKHKKMSRQKKRQIQKHGVKREDFAAKAPVLKRKKRRKQGKGLDKKIQKTTSPKKAEESKDE
ncbi:hypothetical protein PCE1_003237 [Barthelona sp. PCE]